MSVKFLQNDDVAEVIEVAYSSIEKGEISVPIALQNPLHLWNGKAAPDAELRPLGDTEKSWIAFDMSSNGQYMIAGYCDLALTPGRLYKSANSGTSWTEIKPAGDISKYWKTVCISSDGKYMYACEGVNVYYSSDYGVSWNTIYPSMGGIYKIRCSADGSKLLLVANGGYAAKSVNYGASWTEVYPYGSSMIKYYISCDINNDGTKMITCEAGGRIKYSANSGSSWSNLNPLGDVDADWASICFSDNAQYIYAGSNYGSVWISSNYGSTWTEKQLGGSENGWYALSCSEDGKQVCAGAQVGFVYLSVDYGATWEEKKPAGLGNEIWNVSIINESSMIVVACGRIDNKGRIYQFGISDSTTIRNVTVGIKNAVGGNTGEFIEGTPYNNHKPFIECRSDGSYHCPDDAQAKFTPIGGNTYLNLGDLPANARRSLYFRVNLPPDATTGIQEAKIVIGYTD